MVSQEECSIYVSESFEGYLAWYLECLMGMMNRWANMPLITTHGAPLTVCEWSVPLLFKQETSVALKASFGKRPSAYGRELVIRTNSTERSFLRNQQFLGTSRNYSHIVETEVSLPYSQKPTTSKIFQVAPFPSRFPTNTYIYISPLPNTFHGPCPARPPPSDHPNNIWWRHASWLFSLCSSARSAVTGPALGPDVFRALFGVFWCALWKYFNFDVNFNTSF